MKTLILVRHAKSSWDDTSLPDKGRPLNNRGKRDAPKMGERLAKRDAKPDLILSSPARRALKTAEIIAKKLDYKRKAKSVSPERADADTGPSTPASSLFQKKAENTIQADARPSVRDRGGPRQRQPATPL